MTRPRIGMIAPEVCCVQLSCLSCGENVDCTLNERTNTWQIPTQCASCEVPLEVPFFCAVAKGALDNMDPTDQQMRMAGLIP